MNTSDLDAIYASFDPRVGETLRQLTDQAVCASEFRVCGCDTELDTDKCESYTQTLILKNATGAPELRYDMLDFTTCTLTSDGGVYSLSGTAEIFESDSSVPFTITFTDAELKVTVTRAECTYVADPVLHITSLANAVISKYSLDRSLLSESEAEILPLAAELSRLSYFYIVPDELQRDSFSVLASLAEKHGLLKLRSLLDRFDSLSDNEKKREKTRDKITSMLNRTECEALWRNIFTQFTETQKEYPPSAAVNIDGSVLEEARNHISGLLHGHGYEGQYPDFEKRGSIRGVRLGDAYNNIYFVGLEKNAAFRIRCTEEYFNGHLLIRFHCGTQLCRKGDAGADIFSCTFNGNGTRFYDSVSYEKDYVADDGSIASDDLDTVVGAAVKKAELRRLSKKEREAVFGFKLSGLRLFAFIFFVLGGLFGLFMTVGFVLLTILACLLVGQPGSIGELLGSIPWRLIFLFCSVSFGAVMGTCTVLAYTK